MSRHVTWTTPFMEAQEAVARAGDLMEDRRTRDAMLEINKAQIALNEVIEWVLTRKA